MPEAADASRRNNGWRRLASATVYCIGAEEPLKFTDVDHTMQVWALSPDVMVIDYVFKADDTAYYIPRESVGALIIVESKLTAPTPGEVQAIK